MTHMIQILKSLKSNYATWEEWALPDKRAKISRKLALALSKADPEDVQISAPHDSLAPCSLCDELYTILRLNM